MRHTGAARAAGPERRPGAHGSSPDAFPRDTGPGVPGETGGQAKNKQHQLSTFVNDTKLYGEVDRLEGRDAIQRNPDRPERWDCANLMKFNKAKRKVLHLGWDNPKHGYRLGNEWIDNSPVKKV
ncbi:hypothetical protein HGM15179_001695 [Zosterops borbonicus]|uniref:Rna-directed dna polymerase from mobile element jockey-like n=1 Tax=Zosterops borbonicus TaxID=364589 RepID=A0A8K1GV58_9PASS|nr:hypothetical protein HGM15179_001695 [Zosterops borbonicus]